MEFSKQEYWSGVPLALLQIQAVWRPPGMAGLKGQKEQIIQISNVLTSPPPKKKLQNVNDLFLQDVCFGILDGFEQY